MTILVRPILSFASGRLLTSCARQRISKINPAAAKGLAALPVARRGTNPPNGNQHRALYHIFIGP